MPDPALLTAQGLAMLNDIPSWFRGDPDVQGFTHAMARELNTFETNLELIRSSFVPTRASVLLEVWEFTLGLEVNPALLTLAEREDRVVTFLRSLGGDPSGLAWEGKVTAILGSTYVYAEHDPADGGSPAANVIRFTITGSPTSAGLDIIQRYLRQITPANLEIDIAFTGAFILDVSQLDVQAFNG